MPGFFINVDTGVVATHRQLVASGETPRDEPPALPWHPVQGSQDASTAVYSVLRKRVRGQERDAWIGTLCIRYGGQQAFLEQRGWEEVPVDEIGGPPPPPAGSEIPPTG
jgi:hypothetical protein